jgi:hypothetical protein
MFLGGGDGRAQAAAKDAPERIRTSDLRFRRPHVRTQDLALESHIQHLRSPNTRQKLEFRPRSARWTVRGGSGYAAPAKSRRRRRRPRGRPERVRGARSARRSCSPGSGTRCRGQRRESLAKRGTGTCKRRSDRSGPSPRGSSGTCSHLRQARRGFSGGDLRPPRSRCCCLPEGRP